jgi:monovalent cation:H+ antiporter-2, CPA2 family
MEHSVSLITTLAAGFGLALILGFVADAQIAAQLAEVSDGAGTVFVGESELAKSMVSHVLGLVVTKSVGRHPT